MFKTCAELFIVIIIGSGFIKSKLHINSEGEGKQGKKKHTTYQSNRACTHHEIEKRNDNLSNSVCKRDYRTVKKILCTSVQ